MPKPKPRTRTFLPYSSSSADRSLSVINIHYPFSASILMSSHSIAYAAAMAVSGTIIILSFCRPKLTAVAVSKFSTKSDDPQNLRSCTCSVLFIEGKKGKKKMKKRVHAAEVLIDPVEKDCCGPCGSQQEEVRGIPPNRMVLYNGILRDRKHRMTYIVSS
ncbi:hypothetical protein MKW98_024348 [Papaver atlanticum]|uniref:Uncharacterized protein n=1 Tax=Papaver atlanticum TaxID=357466 RepID=A0AAD4XPL3_9MAGN|nr:hypothetical protein MKW98_024348 [Papaver atlanticum]